MVKDPADANASPGGWHTLGGKSTKKTSGNNVVAYKGIDTNQLPINVPAISNSPCLLPSPAVCINTSIIDSLTTKQTSESSPTDNYIYPQNSTKPPIEPENVDAARVNTFYVANKIHDITVSVFFLIFRRS